MRSMRFLFVLQFILIIISELQAAQIFQRKINQWKNNKYDGLWISWSDSLGKKVDSKGHYKNGHEVGTWRYYYEDGALRRIERYSKRGIATKYYYPNGKLKSKGKAILAYEGEFLHYFYQGDWIYYNEDGRAMQVITYERGKEIANKKISSTKSD